MDTALLAVLVAAIAVAANSIVSIFLHYQRVASDGDLAERKFEFDQRMAERKFDFDQQLAERKLTLDQKANNLKQAQELAEQVLTGFYEIQRMMPAIRSPMSYEGQGSTRPAQVGESDGVKRLRDGYYVVRERLTKNNELLSRVMAMQFKAMTLLGAAAKEPFEALNGLLVELTTAVGMLILTAEELPSSQTTKWRNTIWAIGPDDDFQGRLDHVVGDVETICKPILLANYESNVAAASSR